MLKRTSKYPLFAKTGVHWSSYGALLAADSLIRYLEVKLNKQLINIVVDSIIVSRNPKDEDDDISRTMNLFWKISQPALAYPKIHFVPSSGAIKPSALFIGDSYYWNWYKNGTIRNVFNKPEFWYYDKDVFPESFTKQTNTWQVNVDDAVKRQNVIVILQTANGEEFDPGYGFIDRTWPDYDTSANNRIRKIENNLKSSPDNMKMYREKAALLNVSVESVIRAEAVFAENELILKKK
jgi:hypothetical protein